MRIFSTSERIKNFYFLSRDGSRTLIGGLQIYLVRFSRLISYETRLISIVRQNLNRYEYTTPPPVDPSMFLLPLNIKMSKKVYHKLHHASNTFKYVLAKSDPFFDHTHCLSLLCL